jgi:membrane-associated protein
MMDFLRQCVDVFQHPHVYLDAWAASLGAWLYVLLFATVFCETGLVVTPFLPGDSLLFAVGALAAATQQGESPLSLTLLLILLVAAAIIGDAVNYAAGFWIGPRVFKYEHSRLLNRKHLLRTQEFYDRHGGKTIILARFIPIIRTFAPFVAGIGQMQYARFASYNVLGGIAWVATFLLGGYFLGSAVKDQLHYVIVGIIAVSVMPIVIEFFLARRRQRAASAFPLPEPIQAGSASGFKDAHHERYPTC